MIIRSEEIYKKANSIVKSCGTRDTLKIARELGIHLHFLDNLNDLLECTPTAIKSGIFF